MGSRVGLHTGCWPLQGTGRTGWPQPGLVGAGAEAGGRALWGLGPFSPGYPHGGHRADLSEFPMALDKQDLGFHPPRRLCAVVFPQPHVPSCMLTPGGIWEGRGHFWPAYWPLAWCLWGLAVSESGLRRAESQGPEQSCNWPRTLCTSVDSPGRQLLGVCLAEAFMLARGLSLGVHSLGFPVQNHS